MSESLLSLTIIFAELGGVLLLLLIGGIIFYIIKLKKDGKNTRELVAHVKSIIPKHREKLTTHFTDKLYLEESKVNANVNSLIENEAKLYEHLINVSIQKDTGLLKLTLNDINALLNDYVRFLSLQGEEETDTSRDSHALQLKKENEALRLENASLETRLTKATETIENMMGEFSSMYEGGKKEGEQKVKNEMYKLQQSLQTESARAKAEKEALEKAHADDNTENGASS